MSEIINHEEAHLLANHKRHESNLARCYLDMKEQRDELLEALEAIIERWDTPLWKDAPHTGNYINAARLVVAKAHGITDEPQEPMS